MGCAQRAMRHPALWRLAAACAVLLAAASPAAAQAAGAASGPVSPFQAPLAPAAGPALPPEQAKVASISASGLPSWGAFLRAADAVGVQQRVGVLTMTRDRAGKLFFNTTFAADVGGANPVQSVLISVPPFINSSAVTLAVLYMNATQQARSPSTLGHPSGTRACTCLRLSLALEHLPHEGFLRQAMIVWRQCSGSQAVEQCYAGVKMIVV